MMATPKWEPGKLYAPGALVQPRTALPNVPVALQDPGFESGTLDGWDIEIDNPGETSPNVTNYGPHSGTYNLMFDCDGGSPRTTIVGLNKEQPACQPGTLINGSIWLKFSKAGAAGGRAILAFYDVGDNLIGDYVLGTLWQKPGNKSELWYQSPVTGVAPAGTATVRIGFTGFIENDADIRFDTLSWSYNSAAPMQGLIYKAVQAALGASGNVEPTWPPILGQTVVDNEVTWEAVLMSRVVWRARALLVSGPTEPVWPAEDGARVTDNTISWEAISRRVTDPKCPNSKQVLIAASKIFGLDGDIMPYSATVNPLDWSTPEDAGYNPIGLRQYGANPFVSMGLYRNYIAVFNAQGGQLWQPDEDPSQMSQLDAFPIGTQYHAALAPVNDELFILTEAGVRTIGMSAGSGNLQSGDVGMFVDPLVIEAMQDAKIRDIEPRSLYNPNAGQYWLMFADPATAACGVDRSYQGGKAFPSVTDVYLGPATGTVTLEFITGVIPDKFEVWVGGEKVIDTGYRGAVARQADLDAALAARGLPSETIVEYAGEGVPMYASFDKLTAHTKATVKVFAPLSGTGWTFNLGCVDSGEAPDVPRPSTQIFVYTMTRAGNVGAWSRYLLPFAVEDWAIHGDDLLVRGADMVAVLDGSIATDATVDEGGESVVDVPFGGRVWWPYLDFGQPGVTKRMHGIDVVSSGAPSVSIGYDQRNLATFTDAYALPADTLPAGVVRMAVAAPTLSVRIDFAPGQRWALQAVTLYLNDNRVGT